MGCWNGTDSLTGLPIFWGDEIVLIPLIESYGVPSPSLCFDPDDNYSPLGLPIFGCYNDYGGTENIVEDKDNELFFKSLKLYELREGTEVSEDIISKAFKNTSTKTPVTIFRKIMDYAEKNKIEVSNFNEFLNDIVSSSDHFFVKVNQGIFKYSSIDYMMVHRELYERLVKEVGERYPYKEKKTYRELWKEKIVDIVNQKIEKDKELSKIEDPEVRETLFLMESFNDLEDKLELSDCCNPKLTYNYFLNRLSENMDEELLERVVDSILFRSALSLLRRGYNSTTGLGSQNQEIYLHTILADFINRYARKKVEEYREENSTDKTTEKELLTETLFWF